MDEKRVKMLSIIKICTLVVAIMALSMYARAESYSDVFIMKANLLFDQIASESIVPAVGNSPAGEAGHAVLFSVSDGEQRAFVWFGTGEDLSSAWAVAVERVANSIDIEPVWVKADIVVSSTAITESMLQHEMASELNGFYFGGLSLDKQFETSFLEGELNGAGVYDYGNNLLSLDALNGILTSRGHEALKTLPEEMTAFRTRGWICDSDDIVYPLIYNGADYGRRVVPDLNADYASHLIDTASDFLLRQVNDDGSFVYGIHPITGEEMTSYNMLRHSGTIWSLICRYRLFPDEELKTAIEKTIDYLSGQIIYDADGTGYLYEEKTDEIKLGGNGIAIVALTEYMDVFQDDRYTNICEALGEGILKQQGEDGSYWHVLNSDFSQKEPFRTVYYDGECTFALARLFSVTGDQKWLDAACRAVDHFIDKDYTQFRDHWVAYSLNEVTKYVERQDYYDFSLANAVKNYVDIRHRARTYPVNLELLVATFESWQRMVDGGVETGNFDVKELLSVIEERAQHQLSGYFFPEYAMYMAKPNQVLGAFMVRDDSFRVRIDDVQHNIGGYYLYWKNYDAMVAAGLDSSVTDTSERAD